MKVSLKQEIPSGTFGKSSYSTSKSIYSYMTEKHKKILKKKSVQIAIYVLKNEEDALYKCHKFQTLKRNNTSSQCWATISLYSFNLAKYMVVWTWCHILGRLSVSSSCIWVITSCYLALTTKGSLKVFSGPSKTWSTVMCTDK